MPIAPKWLNIQTSNLTHDFSGTIGHDPKYFSKRGRGQGDMTPKFVGVECQ